MKKLFVAPKLVEEQSLATLTLGIGPVLSDPSWAISVQGTWWVSKFQSHSWRKQMKKAFSAPKLIEEQSLAQLTLTPIGSNIP
jgi:hypothetical protein